MNKIEDYSSASIYYNEFDANAANWLRNLGDAGEISKGVVDERSIKEVRGAELAGVRRAHFFAGIGGWELALRIAGWGDAEVWTGSCPCQPYSSAGKQKGDADERNLWPDFFRLISERRPQHVFGEQVASAIKHGWLDRVFADLEGIGYSCGAAVLGAHSVGANHIRQRLYWGAALGSADPERAERCPKPEAGINRADWHDPRWEEASSRSELCGSVDALGEDPTSLRRGRGRDGDTSGDDGEVQAPGLRAVGGLGDGSGDDVGRNAGSAFGTKTESDCGRREDGLGGVLPRSTGPWSDFALVLCTDGKARHTGARVFPLAYGLPRGVGDGGAWRKGLARGASRARIGMLKGSGNAIVPALAAEFIGAFMEIKS